VNVEFTLRIISSSFHFVYIIRKKISSVYKNIHHFAFFCLPSNQHRNPIPSERANNRQQKNVRMIGIEFEKSKKTCQRGTKKPDKMFLIGYDFLDKATKTATLTVRRKYDD